MKFNHEDANANLIPKDTWCDGLIVESIDTTSKKGNEMIVATFRLWAPDGRTADIDHYFVSDYPGMLKKLCSALGMMEQFNGDEVVAESLKAKSVRVLVKIQEDKTGRYGDKNVCAAFEAQPASDGLTPQPGTPVETNEFNPAKPDEVPF